MATPLNDFATKAYSEHPIAIWPLDDDVSYLSLISTNQHRYLTTWTVSKGTTYNNDPVYKPLDPLPFEGVDYSSWKVNSGVTETVTLTSQNIFQTNQLNTDLKSFSINFYLYQASVLVDKYEIGYLKNSVWNLIDTIDATQFSSWIRFSVNQVPAAYDAESMQIQLKVYLTAPTSGTVDHVFTMNGLSIGQWSETTSAVSLGAQSITLLDPVSAYTGVPAEQYGVMSENAYYITENNKLLAFNEGVPMAFGSSNITKIRNSATAGSPSFIFPGKGMLYESGRYLDYSLEFWLRIKPRTTTFERIVGPLDSDYGLYVSENSISLVIGNYVQSHPISEWYRPMLVHLEAKGPSFSLLINGEQVAELIIDRSTIALPSAENSELDWWGFFSYSDIEVFEIDCVSIYPYAVPDLVAKKRFVWGQGVDSEKTIDNYFTGDTASIGYAYANYATNKIYPDVERWDAGYAENITATPNHIQFPDYKLPTINLGGRDLQEWYDDNLKVNNLEYPYSTHQNFVTFRPNIDTSERVNLITNPSLETDTSLWAAFGSSVTIARQTTGGYSGSAWLQVTRAVFASDAAHGATIMNTALDQIPVTPNTTYSASAMVKRVSGYANPDIGISIIWNDASKVYVGESPFLTTPISSSSWTKISVTATAPENAAYAWIVVREYFTASRASAVWGIDAVIAEEAPTAGFYFDGSTDPRARWGRDKENPETAHASVSVLDVGKRANLLTNPSFETNSNGYATSGTGTTTTRITTDAYIGTACLEVTRAAVAASGIRTTNIAVIEGETYTGSYYVKIPTGNQSSSLRCYLSWRDSANAAISVTYPPALTTITDADGWVRVSVTGTAPAGTASVYLYVTQQTAGLAAQKFLVDGGLLENSTTLKGFFDGDFPDASWAGTADASASVVPAWNANGTNWTEPAYFNFESINMLNNQISAIYGIFEPYDLDLETQPLMSFVNNTSGKTFEILVINDELHYILDGVDLETLGVPVSILSPSTHFVAGIDIPTLSQLSYDISEFFSNPQLIQLYVGGNGVSTFEGKIYRVGFSYQENFSEISQHFDGGIAIYDDQDLMTQHYASYTLGAFYRFNRFFLDISAAAEWEEYFPLSYFAKIVKDEYGNDNYKLGAIQINFDSPISYTETAVDIADNPRYTYEDLYNDYNYPTVKQYSILDADFLGKTYSNLDNTPITITQLSPSTYLDPKLTFQLLSEGADEPLSSFTLEKILTDSFVIDADQEATNANPYAAYKTKFGFLDNTVVYPPTAIDFNQVAMVINFKISHDGLLSNPFRMRKLELASFVQEDMSFAKIGTKFGDPVIPYVRNGFYYDKRVKNPVLIYKGNTPYLYLTEKSGVKLLTQSSTSKEYGMMIPVNSDKSATHTVGIVDVWMKYDRNIPLTETAIFEIDYDSGSVQFTMVDDGTGRGVISANGGTVGVETEFYQNGVQVNNPVIEPNEWNVISILFPNSLTFNGYSGSIRLFSDTVFKSVTPYQSAGLGESFSIDYRPWQYVLNSDPTNPSPPANNLWSDWNGTLGTTWQDVLVISASGSFITTSEDIYNTYIGTNRSVVDDADGISIYNDDVNIYTDITWYTTEYIPS
jgi:hypothetical protein